ncbi:MAG TPA: PilN domain-containing protein [Hyphomicrobiaceae bacterium]|jgi:general secretion pathway protein L|nr:PilN domain-containing protein [Hyphomicrobiaceae bacterium]
MPTIAQTIAAANSGIVGFLKWWGEELGGLLPQRVAGRTAAKIVICVGPEGYRLLESGGGKLRPARGGAELSALDAVGAVGELARANSAAEVGIRVPLASCFVRSVELPRSAQEDASRILDLDLERATPFKLKDVYCATLVENDDGRGPQVRARHLMIKRSSVEPLLGELNASGVAVDFIDCWDDGDGQTLPVNFLASQQQLGAAARGGLSFLSVLLALLALLGLSALLLANSRYQTALDSVQGQVHQARAQATSVRRALDTSEAALTEIEQLQRLKLATTPTVEVMDALTKLLPNSVWLTDFKLESGTLDITGLAKSGAALLPLFEHSPLFADAGLASGVNFDPQENKERFSLRLRVRQQGGEPATAEREEKR